MPEEFQNYLLGHGFREVPVDPKPSPGIVVRAFENPEFRLYIVNERSSETYVQIASLEKPEDKYFLLGLVAFFTEDDAATRTSGHYPYWLETYHSRLAALFSSKPEGQLSREQFAMWRRDFATREQSRLAMQAAEARAKRKPWWKLW